MLSGMVKIDRKLFVRGELFTHQDERSDNTDTGFNCNLAVQDTRKHQSAVLGKNPRQFAPAAMRT
jgi:hypothetical protein